MLEPTNPYDRNAIAVRIGQLIVGYLSRDDARAYAPVFQWAAARRHSIAAKARLIGGWDRGQGDVGSIGVILHMGTPAECMVELLLDDPVRTDHRWAGQLIAFTGDSTCRLNEMMLDHESCIVLATKAGMVVHPRVTKQVQLLVDCDDSGVSGNQAKAIGYGIPVIDELAFWQELGIPVMRETWTTSRR